MKTIFALAMLASIAAAPAMAETFTRDGITYNYTSSTAGQATVISGRVVNTGETFRLKVQGGRVVGKMGARDVSFHTAAVETAAAAGTVLAAK